MNNWNMVVYWILALLAVATFYFAYRIVKEVIQKRRLSREPQVKPTSVPGPVVKTSSNIDFPAAAHGYDSPELCREDVMLHLEQFRNQLVEHKHKIENILSEVDKLDRCT